MGVKKILLDNRVVELNFSSDFFIHGSDLTKLYKVLQSQNMDYSFKQHKNDSFALAIKTGASNDSTLMANVINKLLKEHLSV